ncbi:uncharacterized protein UV8b_01781 [Ustilaginoidea virens]|uniref:Uncharacterized protein n=1 Tax=Ustilaginoidea virens TaxID=1159556 RepID=A0A8E5HL91_USTVR|nr:uncharacterized protein UV8b_01781 [Ustilaginoidea virens]QUC17540.1 hypothetical protein UV8b_01781 [Ustilaginoidea virens]
MSLDVTKGLKSTVIMSPNQRLYVALYARGGKATMPSGEDKYHWSFIQDPKVEDEKSQGTRYHAMEKMGFIDGQAQSVWQFDETDIGMAPTAMILVRVLIGKVKKKDRLETVMRNIPIRAQTPGWNCVSWVKEAIQTLQQHQGSGRGILGSSACQLDWETVRQSALWYVEQKRAAHRFDGQAAPGTFDKKKVPTWDLLKNAERTP